MSQVFVLDTNKRPLAPTHPARARALLTSGKAAVYRRYPFVIILKRAVEASEAEPLRVKLDPGSHTTGLAIVNDVRGEVVFAAEIRHRGMLIKKALDGRRVARHSRRRRKTRYRQPRFQNRRRSQGWLSPSLESRIGNVITWVKRLMHLCPIVAISQELVKFDPQLMDHPEISGIQYQQGTLAGYETREYLLEKWGRACAYCGKTQVPLQVEHIQPRANGGTDRISNLALACEQCNQAKGIQDIRTFLTKQPERLERILAQAKAPLKDAAAVNATRWLLYERLKALGLPVECGSGGLTKYNRTIRGLPKAHWIDAACTGMSTPADLHLKRVQPLLITASGHGCRQMCLMDKYGFPRTKAKAKHFAHRFKTGDIVKAVVPAPLKHPGVHIGRVSAKANGQLTIATNHGKMTAIGKKYCQLL